MSLKLTIKIIGNFGKLNHNQPDVGRLFNAQNASECAAWQCENINQIYEAAR